MWLCVSLVYSFYCCIVCHCMDVPQCAYPFICWRPTELSAVLKVMNKTFTNSHIQLWLCVNIRYLKLNMWKTKLLTLPSEYIQNPTSFYYLHCYHPGSIHPYLISSYCLSILNGLPLTLTVYSQYSSQRNPSNALSQIMSLLCSPFHSKGKFQVLTNVL